MTVTGVEQDEAGVRVTVADQAGRSAVVSAEYLIGADGPKSMVRERIGSGYLGEHALRPNFGMVFRAAGLWPHVAHGPAVHYWVVNPAAPALLGPLDTEGTWWIIAFGVDRETGEREARRLIDDAAGVPVEATVLSTDPWTARMQLVDRMRVGRVFLAGDAAHLNPPFGGHGLNTGLGDAVDLGWKLAAVLQGWGGPRLLDSYQTERRPVQEQVLRSATANMAVTSTELLADNLGDDDAGGLRARQAAGERIQQTKHQEFHALDLVLGITITDSPVIVSDQVGRAGALLPHRWLTPGRSLYDELGEGFTLLRRGGEGHGGEIEKAARIRFVPIKIVDEPAPDGDGPALALVRPDRYLAWAGDGEPADALALIDAARGA
jgi:2-polyprenyl-6-methoxyphenol hydroxylase-like FAD-dependent oxidoreductase